MKLPRAHASWIAKVLSVSTPCQIVQRDSLRASKSTEATHAGETERSRGVRVGVMMGCCDMEFPCEIRTGIPRTPPNSQSIRLLD